MITLPSLPWQELTLHELQTLWVQVTQRRALARTCVVEVSSAGWMVEVGEYMDWARFAQAGLERRLRMLGCKGVTLRFAVVGAKGPAQHSEGDQIFPSKVVQALVAVTQPEPVRLSATAWRKLRDAEQGAPKLVVASTVSSAEPSKAASGHARGRMVKEREVWW